MWHAHTRKVAVLLWVSVLFLPFSAAWADALPGMERQTLSEPVFGGQISVSVGGAESGPTVILVHGLAGDSATAWRELLPSLLDDYRVIAFDLPGFGESDKGNHLYDQDAYARVLKHVIGLFSEQPVIVIGHSLGGAVTLRHAARYPEQVKRLILVSVAGILHRASYSEFLAGFQPDRGGESEWTHPALGAAIRKAVRRLPSGDRLLQSATFRALVLDSNPELIAAMALAATDFSQDLDRVEAPTTVIWGSDDATSPLRTGHLLAARLPWGSLTVLPGTAHMPMREDAEGFNQVANAALQGPLQEDRVRPSVGPGDKDAHCRDESGWHLNGAYRRIVIENCDGAVLNRVSARQIVIENSQVNLLATVVDTGDEEIAALKVRNSRVMITAGRLQGELAIDAGRSSLDIAGTHLRGREYILDNPGTSASELVFSVAPYVAEGRRGYWHEVIALEGGERM